MVRRPQTGGWGLLLPRGEATIGAVLGGLVLTLAWLLGASSVPICRRRRWC